MAKTSGQLKFERRKMKMATDTEVHIVFAAMTRDTLADVKADGKRIIAVASV